MKHSDHLNLFKRVPDLTNVGGAFLDVNGALTSRRRRSRVTGILPVSVVQRDGTSAR